MEIKAILILITCGIILALLSALYSQDMTVGLGASITGYGLPKLWLEKVTYIVPGTPDKYALYDSGIWLLVDVLFWIVIVAITYITYKIIKK